MSMTHPQLHILGVRVDDVSVDEALVRIEEFLSTPPVSPPYEGGVRGGRYITTPNPEICLYALKDEHCRRDILDKAFLALPDGFGLSIAAWILGTRLRNRVTGVDFTCALMKRAAKRGWRVFLFGGEGVAHKCADVLTEQYHNLRVVGVSDGQIPNVKFQMSNKIQIPNDQIVETINQTQPDILLVALGAPRQEYWIAENLPKLSSVKLAVGVGGTFDFISGKVKRAPKAMRVVGIEWLWRLCVQPWRARRIFNATLKFLATVLLWRVRMAFIYRRNVVGLIIRGGLARRSESEGGCSSVVECLLPKQKIAGSIPVTRSSIPLLTKEGQGEVLLVERADEQGHWQLPQGGIDKGETPKLAIMREMKEEIGTDEIKIIKHISNFYRYEWPKVDKLRRGYRGQKQDLFILDFTGADNDIHIDNREHSDYQWAPIEHATQTVHEIRREQAEKAIKFCYDTTAFRN